MTKQIECSRLPERGKWFTVCDDTDYLVVAKGAGLPCAPLKGGSYSLFESLVSSFPDLASVHGKKEGEGGLIHRIDTETCGLVLIARNDAFFSHIMELRKSSDFSKSYTAYSLSQEDRLPEKEEIKSRFRAFGKKGASVRPVFDGSSPYPPSPSDLKKAGSREYVTEVVSSTIICSVDKYNLIKVECSIKEGFRHQVRSHLAFTGFPVLGDSVYGEALNGGLLGSFPDMLFYASGLSFPDVQGKLVTVNIASSLLDDKAVKDFKEAVRK